MPIIDAQVHAYERDRPGRPWVGTLAGPPEVTGSDMVAAMDAVGVDGAVLVSPYSMYRYDASYALQDLCRRIRPASAWSSRSIPPTPASRRRSRTGRRWKVRSRCGSCWPTGFRGTQTMPASRASSGLRPAAGCRSTCSAGACSTRRWRSRRPHPDTRLVIDHLGLKQPFDPPAPPEPFADLPDLLALADCENVVVKITGACTLSRMRHYPYDDIWDPLCTHLRALRHRPLPLGHGLDPRRQPHRL